MKALWIVAWLVISTSALAEYPQPPCSFFLNKVMDILHLPWDNKDLAPVRVLKILKWQGK